MNQKPILSHRSLPVVHFDIPQQPLCTPEFLQKIYRLLMSMFVIPCTKLASLVHIWEESVKICQEESKRLFCLKVQKHQLNLGTLCTQNSTLSSDSWIWCQVQGTFPLDWLIIQSIPIGFICRIWHSAIPDWQMFLKTAHHILRASGTVAFQQSRKFKQVSQMKAVL